jgi:hypothetical protein
MFQINQAKKLMNKYNINSKVVSPSTFKKALNVETEHRNVTYGSPYKTALIAIAHLKEDPKYYKKLIKQEKGAERFYKTHKKPSIYN